MRPEHQPAINWATAGQPLFDRIVEALVQRLYDEHWDVRPIEGRGGDGGLDIECVRKSSGERHVFQLKYFPEGFSGKHGKRRDQIKRSFTALDPMPDRWILVAPCSTDQSGYTFLNNLVGTRTELVFWHRARLDELFAAHRDLVGFFERGDQVLEQAKILGQERAALASAADLTQRLRDLSAVSDTTDPDWALDFTREGDRITQTLRAKHARAAEVSPINISFNLDPSGLPEHDRVRLRDLDHGLAGSVTFPAELVTQFAVDGPELVRQEPTDGMEITVVQSPNPGIVGKPVQLHLESAGAEYVFHGILVDGRPGPAGSSLRAVFEDIVTITMLLPKLDDLSEGRVVTDSCTVRIELDYPESPRVEQVQTVSDLMLRLADGDRMELRQVSGHLVTFGLDRRTSIDRDLYVDQKDLADDLAVVQRKARNRFPMPTEVSVDDRITVRALRLALEYGHTYAPGITGVKGTVTPDALSDRALASLLAGDSGAIILRQDPFQVEIFGHTLALPQMGLYHPSLRLLDPEHVRQGLEHGRDVEFHLRSEDGSSMTLIGPAYPSEGMRPRPWGLRGIPEPKALPGAEKDGGDE